MDIGINVLHRRNQGTNGRNYLVYIRARRWSWMGRKRSISLVLKTKRGRSARLGLRILNILRFAGKVKMISPTMVIGIRVRIVGWRKTLSNIYLSVTQSNLSTQAQSTEVYIGLVLIEHSSCIEGALCTLFIYNN